MLYRFQAGERGIAHRGIGFRLRISQTLQTALRVRVGRRAEQFNSFQAYLRAGIGQL
ncbi:hypothetical protein D3C73_1580760 [compost metagenome]